MKKKNKFKTLYKKLNKTNKAYKWMFYIISILYVISVFTIGYSVLLLNGIETFLRVVFIIAMIIYIIISSIGSMALLITKKHGILILVSVITVIFTAVNGIGFYYIEKTYNVIDDISKEKIIYTTNLIALSKDTDIKHVGLIKNEKDVEGYMLPQEYIATNGKKYIIDFYDSDTKLLKALYDKEVDGIFVSANYIIKYSNYEGYEDIQSKTVVIDSFSKKMDNLDKVESTNKSVTEPFTILLLGVDSEYEGLSNNSAFNGDSIMLISFNPKTLSATVFSIPRDTYVPIACNNDKSYKINSAAGYGTSCMIKTIENLTDITIDYYVKINFKGVVSLVNALDGINVDVEEPDYNHNLSLDCGKNTICEQNSNREFGDKTIYITPGKNVELNGEQALAYSRNRHQWAISDFKRIEHQQAVVTAIANKAKTIKSIDTFYRVLNAVSNNIDTNMSTKEILNLYNVGKNILLNDNFEEGEFINIQKTSLSGYDLTLYLNGMNTYTFQYYEESLKEITDAMKENLELQKPEAIKTFSFSANEEYVAPTIGKTYTAVKRNETLPDFVGSSISYASSWTEARSISINKTYEESNECTNDNVLDQSVHKGSLVNSISSITFKICKNKPVDTNSNVEDNNTNNNDDNNSNEQNDVIENILNP